MPAGNGRPKLPRPSDNGAPTKTPSFNPGGRAPRLDEAFVRDVGLALSILPSKIKVRKLLGVAESTWSRWQRRGGLEAEAGTNSVYSLFHETLEAAGPIFEKKRLLSILEAANDYEKEETIVSDVVDSAGLPTGRKKVTRKKITERGDWRAAAWLLERRFADRYGPKQEIKHAGELTLVAALSRIAHEEGEPDALEAPV